MNIHVLFCPTETVAADGASFPIASLALSLDDEVQYRCAGFIQAEIERYAEELGETTPSAETSSDGDDDSSESDDDQAAVKGKKNRATRGKKATKDDDPASM
jgi:cohesin complex subunit SA-1/2